MKALNWDVKSQIFWITKLGVLRVSPRILLSQGGNSTKTIKLCSDTRDNYNNHTCTSSYLIHICTWESKIAPGWSLVSVYFSLAVCSVKPSRTEQSYSWGSDWTVCSGTAHPTDVTSSEINTWPEQCHSGVAQSINADSCPRGGMDGWHGKKCVGKVLIEIRFIINTTWERKAITAECVFLQYVQNGRTVCVWQRGWADVC